MMKSFFKKLSLVMALAMVVSMMAPAASAFAATATVALKDRTPVATHALEVGAEEDYCFLGAPANWKELGWKWTSSNPDVATVDEVTGLTKGVADGVATITITVGDVYTAAVEVTVGTPKVELAYEVVQTSDKVAEIVFNQNVNYTKADLSVEMVYDGGYTATWPIKNFTCKDNKITFEPYVPFQNGDKYLVKVGAEDEGTEFVTRIDRPNRIELTYKTLDMGDMGKMKAYTNGEDGAELTVQMSAKLFLDQIDVTSVYSTEDIVYSLAQENENVMVDEYAGTLTFAKAGVATTVIANYVYYDADDNEIKVPGVIDMVSEKVPAYAVTGVKAWTIATGTEIDWSKPNHTVPAYDEGQLVALITDNYGNVTATVAGYTHKNAGTVLEPTTGTRFSDEGYYVTYFSANNEKLLVGVDGTLTTYTKANVPAIFELKNTNLETTTQLVRNMYAATVVVSDSRKFDHIDVNTSSVTLVTDGEFTFAEDCIKVTAYDNYGNPWNSKVDLTVSCSVDGTTNIPSNTSFTKEQKFSLDGSEILCDKSTFTLTFKVGNSSKTVKVNLKDPKYYDHDDNKATPEVIKITSYQLEATDANQTVDKAAKATVNAKVNYYTLSNGYKVGTVSASQAALVTNENDLKLTTDTATKGDQFVVVYYPNGKIVGAASGSGFGVSGEDGKYEVTVAYANEDGQMQYAATGTYTVKVLQVSSFNKKGEAVFSTKYSTTFKVENKNAAVALMKQEKIETDKTAIEDIVLDTLKFTLGGSEWKKLTAAMIVTDPEKTVWVENEQSSYIVINKVTINVPVDGDKESAYYTVTVDVNKAVKVPTDFNWAE